MSEPASVEHGAGCRVRGCSVVLRSASLAEWGVDGFLIASYHAPISIPHHAHWPLQISLPISGSWLHTFDRRDSTILTSGTAAFIPSGDFHDTRGSSGGELITINAELEWCEEHCDLTMASLRTAKRQDTNAPLQGILQQASRLLRGGQPDPLYLASIGLTATLGVIHGLGLRSRSSTRITHAGPLRRVIGWVDEHLGERMTLTTLAAIAGCSQWHLVRLFNTCLGTTPARYVVSRRLARARELLRVRRADITDVALRCGFSSQSHFTRAFARAYGEAPGAYRRHQQESSNAPTIVQDIPHRRS